MTHHSSPVTDTELKPCPFCGCDAEQERYQIAHDDCTLFGVSCKSCTARVRGFDQCQADANEAWNTRSIPAQTPGSDVEHGADYLFDELDKLGAHVTYTACKALVTKLYALGIPAQTARADIAKAIAYDLENGSAHGARVATTSHLDNYHVHGHVNLLALADAVLALTSTERCDHGVKVGNTCIDCLGAAVTRPVGNAVGNTEDGAS